MTRRKGRKKRGGGGGGGGGHGGGGLLQGMRYAFRRAAGAEASRNPDGKGSKLWNILTWLALAGALGYLAYRYLFT
jgi:hypothetical protein